MSTLTVYHAVENLIFDDNNMHLTIDGRNLRFSLERISTRLQKATIEQRRYFEISASGYGIHWPLIDEDLSVDGLLRLAD